MTPQDKTKFVIPVADGTITLTTTPGGSRDVYWCYIGFEPGIVTYKDDIALCGVCNGELEGLERMHVFLFHMYRPQLTPPDTK